MHSHILKAPGEVRLARARDRYPYELDKEVREALEKQYEKTGVPRQTIIDRAVRKALGLGPKRAKPKKRGA